jgi:hypothetical protein
MIPIVHRFYARGGTSGVGLPTDPASVEAAMTPADSMTPVLAHSRATPGLLTRSSVGVWVFHADPALLEPSKLYVVHFRYHLPIDGLRVDRHPFRLTPALPAARPGYCILYGALTTLDGLPDSGATVRVEVYSSPLHISHRVQAETVITEVDGTYWFEAPHGALVRFSTDQDNRFILTPAAGQLDVRTVADYTLQTGSTDAFGMPVGPDPDGGFNLQLPGHAAPGFVTVERTGGNCQNDGLWSYTHEQHAESTTWIIEHPLAYVPAVRAVGPTGKTMLGDVSFPSIGLVHIDFALAVKGAAYLS